jgi:hypothetical protein
LLVSADYTSPKVMGDDLVGKVVELEVSAAGPARPIPIVRNAMARLETNPDAATPVAASRACVAPAILVALPFPVVVIDLEMHVVDR